MAQYSLERYCRLCAQEKEVTIMLFSQEAQALDLQNKLHKYLLIEVDEDDRLPKNICIPCCTKLKTVCEFIDTARKAQEDLLIHISAGDSLMKPIKTELDKEDTDEEGKYTQLEVNVDPMMVLENSDGPSTSDDNTSVPMEDVTYLHGVDAENVTIKLIKKYDTTIKEDCQDTAKPFPCSNCDRSFLSELALKNHTWIHLSETKVYKHYKCETCSEAFHYKYDFVTHLKKHRTGECQICGRLFRSDKTYQDHMSVHLPTNKSYTCKVCGRSYNTWGGLKYHMISHSSERPYQCQYCKKSFKRNQDLKFHINQHTGARPYKCPFCEKCFASSGNCYSHRSRMHPGKTVTSTKTRRTKTQSNATKDTKRPVATKLENNLVSVNGIFKYQCNLCDHSFLKKENFTYHMYKHTGEKPFQCSLCPAKFVTRKGQLIHHEKLHPDEDRPLGLISKNVLLK